jgi:hypothetical protein
LGSLAELGDTVFDDKQWGGGGIIFIGEWLKGSRIKGARDQIIIEVCGQIHVLFVFPWIDSLSGPNLSLC